MSNVERIIEQVKRSLSSGDSLAKEEALRQELRNKCKSDLWFFAYHACEFKDIKNPLHFEMCKRWQNRSHRRFTLWLIPRSHLKTSLWTIAGTLWEFINNPHQRFLIANAKLANAVSILADVRSILRNNELFRWLFPEYCLDLASKDPKYAHRAKQCKDTQDRLDFPCSKYAGRKEGSIETISVDSSLVSKHYDVMIFDDPVNDENTTTREYRDRVHNWYKNALQLRDNPITSRVRLIGTRWHFDDLYARLIKSEKKRRAAARERGDAVKPVYLIYRRKAVENGTPIWSERFTLEELNRLKHEELGSYIYSCQYDNDPLPEEDAHFKRNHLHEIDLINIPENVVNFAAIDLADEETTRGDYSVITVASFDCDGRMYVREIVRGKYSMLKIMEEAWRLTKKWNLIKIAVEATTFQKTLLRTYRSMATKRGWHMPFIEMTRAKTTKFKRIMGLQPRTERGDFTYEEGIPHAEAMVEELITFPLGVHDDIADTLADIETLYTHAPALIEPKAKPNTFAAYFGSLEDLEVEDIIDETSSFIGRPW